MRRRVWAGIGLAVVTLAGAAVALPGNGGRMLTASRTLGLARPMAVAAAGEQAVVAYRAAGRLLVAAVRGSADGAAGPGRVVMSARAPADGAVTLVPARLPGGQPGLYLLAGGEAWSIVLPTVASGVPQAPAAVAPAAIGPEPVRRALAADLDGDGTDELLLIRGEAEPPPEGRPGLGARVEVWQVRNGALRLAWQGMEKYRPWQLTAGDIDGDGTPEWAAGVWTKAVYDPQWAERPWFYRWKDGQPFALWLGSRLAHPFADFALSPLAPGEPAALVAVEAARDGGQTLSLYRWNSFGFTLEQGGPTWERVLAFTALPPATGCPMLAAVVEPGPALVLLASGPGAPGSGSPLQEATRHPLASATAPSLAAVPGALWLLDSGRLTLFNPCPR